MSVASCQTNRSEIAIPVPQINEKFVEETLHRTSYVNIPSGDCGDRRASTLFTNLQGIIT